MGKTKNANRKAVKPGVYHAAQKVAPPPLPPKKAEAGPVEYFCWIMLQAAIVVILFLVAVIVYIYYSPNIGAVSDDEAVLDNFFYSQPDKADFFDYSMVSYEKIGLLQVATAGPKTGKMLIFLHGFPETGILAWYPQIAYFAEQGYFVVAPDQRGYGHSEKPSSVMDYHLDHLADDIVKIIDHYGRSKAVVAGHDWGAAVAWHLGTFHADRLEQLIIINVPHPYVMSQHLRTWTQLAKSWYIFFFQVPYVPEAKIYKDNFRWLTGVFSMSPKGTFPLELIEKYHEAWEVDGAVTGMLNWYRAAIRTVLLYPKQEPRNITVPTLMIWGDEDRALGSEMAQPSIDMCDDGQLVMLSGVTHWVQHEAGERVNHIIHSFLQ